jgi:nucleoside 2-deoxyribosyltransferase
MKRNKVYLAGPISGHSYNSVNEWRDMAKLHLLKFDIDGFSPMRNKIYLSEEKTIKDNYSNFTMSSINGINVRDYNDCKTSDAILVNFLDSKEKISIGTVMEIAWARAFQIPVVIVMEETNPHNHGMLTFGNIVVNSLEEGLDAIVQILCP